MFTGRSKRNMKKLITLILSLLVALSFTTMISFANAETNVYIEELPDGSYYEITITEFDSQFSFFAATQTKAGAKTVDYKNASGTSLWSVKVTGRFTYNGTSATCTSSEVSASSYNATWKISNKTSSKLGSTASATATAKQYENGSVLQTISRTAALTCSTKGVLS